MSADAVGEVAAADLTELNRALEIAYPPLAESIAAFGVKPDNISTPTEALQILRDGLERNGENPGLRLIIGLALLRFRAFAAAGAQFKTILAGHPTHLPAFRGLAIALIGEGRLAEAVRAHAAVLNGLPGDLLARNSLLRLLKTCPLTDEQMLGAYKACMNQFLGSHPELGPALSPVTALEEWCHANGVPRTALDPQLDVAFGSGGVTYRADATSSFEIRGAEIVAGWDFVITPDGQVLDGSGYLPISVELNAMPHLLNSTSPRAVYSATPNVIEIPGRTLFLSGPTVFNVGHWISDFLPRLRALKPEDAGHVRLAMPGPVPRRYSEFLDRCSDGASVMECKFGQRYRFESLIVMDHFDHNRPQPAAVKFLQSRLADINSQRDRRMPGRRLYLRRSEKALGRRVINDTELRALLREARFEIVSLSDLSVAEQSAMFAMADIVIASWGADMAAMFQMPRGCDLIVLVPTDDGHVRADDQLERYAAILNMRLQYYPGLAVGPRRNNVIFQDMRVDCEGLQEIINKVILQRES